MKKNYNIVLNKGSECDLFTRLLKDNNISYEISTYTNKFNYVNIVANNKEVITINLIIDFLNKVFR